MSRSEDGSRRSPPPPTPAPPCHNSFLYARGNEQTGRTVLASRTWFKTREEIGRREKGRDPRNGLFGSLPKEKENRGEDLQWSEQKDIKGPKSTGTLSLIVPYPNLTRMTYDWESRLHIQ